MTDLIELAERVEKATGPDREIDRDIALLLFDASPPETPDFISKEGIAAYREIQRKLVTGKPFTASLDVALTLVPEGYAFSVGNINPQTCRCSAWVMPPPFSIGADHRTGATPALALTAAALRASHSQSR